MRWEYKTFELNAYKVDNLEEHLNKIGKEGWELVMCRSHTLIFKRPKDLCCVTPTKHDFSLEDLEDIKGITEIEF